MAAVSLFWNTNMAAMTSCENVLLAGFGFTTLNWKLLYRLQQIQNQSLFGAFVTSRRHEFYRRIYAQA